MSSFCLEIFGESFPRITQSSPERLKDGPVQASRHVCKMRELGGVPQTTVHTDLLCAAISYRPGNACQRLRFGFIKVNDDSFFPTAGGSQHMCLLSPLLFNEQQAISLALRGPQILRFYFSLIKGPFPQPLLANW